MSWVPRPLETPRLTLHPTGGDAAPSSDADTVRREGLPNQWRIEVKGRDGIVGLIGFIKWDPDAACAEVGFGLVRAMWGHGFMTEACHSVVAYGFAEMGLRRIEARCQVTNPASARVLEKVAMRREGTVRGRIHSKAPEEDFHLYAIEASAERPSIP